MQLEVGAILEGKVTGITKFGAFIELPEGKTGMVHISEVAPTYVKEIRDYLENGNIKNSVNYPNCDMGMCSAEGRIAINHRNIVNMISQFTKVIGEAGVNISDMTNKSKANYAYTLIDLESPANEDMVKALEAIDGVLRVRIVK